MTPYRTAAQSKKAKQRVQELELKRNKLPEGPERDRASQELDAAQDDYEDRL